MTKNLEVGITPPVQEFPAGTRVIVLDWDSAPGFAGLVGTVRKHSRGTNGYGHPIVQHSVDLDPVEANRAILRQLPKGCCDPEGELTNFWFLHWELEARGEG